MELDNLKSMWKEQDLKLEKSIKQNQDLMRNTFKQKTNGIIERFLKWEYFSLIEFVIFLFFMVIATYKSINDWRFLTAGFFIITFFILCIVIIIKSIYRLNSIDLYSKSIVDTKHLILKYRKLSNKFMKFFLFIIPPVLVSFLLLGVKLIRNINLFDNPTFFIVLASSVLIISYPLALVSYKTICLRNYKEIENNLIELEKFMEN